MGAIHPPLDDLNTRITAGSDSDFDAVYRATYLQLRRTLTAILGDPSAAEDCVQETFVRAYRAWPRWRKDAPVQAWLHRIAINVAATHRRRQAIRSVKEALWLSRGKPPGDPADVAIISEVRHALSRLPPKQSAAIVLHYYHGRTLEEAAVYLGVSKRAVAFRLADARANLQRILGPDWDFSLPSLESGGVYGLDKSLDGVVGR